MKSEIRVCYGLNATRKLETLRGATHGGGNHANIEIYTVQMYICVCVYAEWMVQYNASLRNAAALSRAVQYLKLNRYIQTHITWILLLQLQPA